MHELSLAEGVAVRLVEAERAIDAALEAQARLVTGLLQARTAARLPSSVGDAAVMCAAAASAALGVARRESADCHRALAEVGARLGLAPVDVGQGDKAPPEHPHKPAASLGKTDAA